MPSGLTLNSNGTITGTTTDTLDTYIFDARATDSGDEPCQTTKEMRIELADACDVEHLPESLDATNLRDWFITWSGVPNIFDFYGPAAIAFAANPILPMTNAPGDPIGIRYGVAFDAFRGITVYEEPVGSCIFGLIISMDCFARWFPGTKASAGPTGQYGPPISQRSAACDGNQPPSESVTIAP